MTRSSTLSCLLILSLTTACSGAPSPQPESTADAPRPTTSWPEGNYAINLYDAFGGTERGLRQDFGFSALVRFEGKTILFDAGSNADTLKHNCERMGIDLRDVDFAVASHAHFDHINGFDYLLEVNPDVKIYFPADMFWGKNVEFDISGREPDAAAALPPEQRYFEGETEGFRFDQSGRFWGADVEYVSDTTEIAPGVTLVATTSPFIGYFTRYPSVESAEGQDGHGADDDVRTMGLPELSMSLSTTAGEVLLVGCSHSLVETIVRETKAELGRDVAMVLGGYHLLPYGSEQVREIATRMRDELGVGFVAPAHCTGHVGFRVFGEVFGDRYHVAGLGSRTPFPAD